MNGLDKKHKKRSSVSSLSSCSFGDNDDDDEDDIDNDDDGVDGKNEKVKKESKKENLTRKRGRLLSDDEEDNVDGVSDDVDMKNNEDDWLMSRRSCRSRKEISYKFEEFETMISGAIEDDVKGALGAGGWCGWVWGTWW